MEPLTFVMITTFLAVMFGVLLVVFATDFIRTRTKPEESSGSKLGAIEPDPRFLDTHPPYAEEVSPFWPQHLLHLFIRPRKFFAGQLALGKTPSFVIVTWCYGIASAIDQVYRDLVRETAGRPKSLGQVMDAMLKNSWFEFWLWVLGIGAVVGFMLWWMGGWWFSVRLRWSGVKELSDRTAHLLYVYSSFVESVPTIAMALFWTATEVNFREAFTVTVGRPYLAVLLIFPFWSLVVSYIGARTLFGITPWKARVWLLGAPMILYIFQFGLLTFAINSLRM
jgi:hypothetical protein